MAATKMRKPGRLTAVQRPPMTLTELRGVLLARRRIVLENLQRLDAERPAPVRGLTGDHLADEEGTEQAGAEIIRNHREREYRAEAWCLDACLAQIRAGDRPTCDFCDEELEDGRLLTYLKIKSCVSCRETLERRHPRLRRCSETGEIRIAI